MATDGEYSVEVSANCDARVRLFCHGMQSDAPKEYVTLLSGPLENFAYVHDYKQPSAAKDTCNKASGKTLRIMRRYLHKHVHMFTAMNIVAHHRRAVEHRIG